MVKTLRESKAKLSELVERASRGEDVLITVRGTVKARLTKVEASPAGFDGRAWVRELRTLQEAVKRRKKPKLAIERILADHRADRV
jgi:prevent-host-death family protein